MPVWNVGFYDNSDDATPSHTEDVEATSEEEAVVIVIQKMGTTRQRADLTRDNSVISLARRVASAGTAPTMTSSG